jgi:methylated-DNA-[protein]-cysteine S-methyltransferase
VSADCGGPQSAELRVSSPVTGVVGANGALTGYAGGLARKRALLELEESADKRDERLF